MKPLERVMNSVPKDQMYLDVWNATQSMDALRKLYYELLMSLKPIAFQSLAMQIGHAGGFHKDPSEAFKYGTIVLLELQDIGLFKIRKGKGLSIVSHYRIEPEIRALIEAPDYTWKAPKWRRQGDKVILGRGNHHEGKQGVDVLNILQGIEFRIDPDIFLQYTDVKLFETDQFKNIASELLGKSFSFRWDFDKRGRSYSTGYDIQLQGNEYKKALLSFAEKRVVTGE